MIFYEGQLSRSHLELSFAKITVFPNERTDVRTDIGSEKLADVIGASRNNVFFNAGLDQMTLDLRSSNKPKLM